VSPLRKLREIMDHIYALFDRRCRTQTALGKLKSCGRGCVGSRGIGETLKKVFSPHLGKALTFLDDNCAGDLHAVERGNRRHRKIQKIVYRVRSKVCLEGRIALTCSENPVAKAETTPRRRCTGTQGIYVTQNLYYSATSLWFPCALPARSSYTTAWADDHCP